VDVMGSRQVRCVWYIEVLFLSVKRTDQLCFRPNRAIEGVLTTRLTEVGGVMCSWSAGRASPARGGVEGMLLVKSRYQHQQTRAAAAREGCRSMDAARK
jgi:hypothetical protein